MTADNFYETIRKVNAILAGTSLACILAIYATGPVTDASMRVALCIFAAVLPINVACYGLFEMEETAEALVLKRGEGGLAQSSKFSERLGLKITSHSAAFTGFGLVLLVAPLSPYAFWSMIISCAFVSVFVTIYWKRLVVEINRPSPPVSSHNGARVEEVHAR